MEEIKVYNTLTGEKTVFRPLVPGKSRFMSAASHRTITPISGMPGRR